LESNLDAVGPNGARRGLGYDGQACYRPCRDGCYATGRPSSLVSADTAEFRLKTRARSIDTRVTQSSGHVISHQCRRSQSIQVGRLRWAAGICRLCHGTGRTRPRAGSRVARWTYPGRKVLCRRWIEPSWIAVWTRGKDRPLDIGIMAAAPYLVKLCSRGCAARRRRKGCCQRAYIRHGDGWRK
jgi:hypothetical protein